MQMVLSVVWGPLIYLFIYLLVFYLYIHVSWLVLGIGHWEFRSWSSALKTDWSSTNNRLVFILILALKFQAHT